MGSATQNWSTKKKIVGPTKSKIQNPKLKFQKVLNLKFQTPNHPQIPKSKIPMYKNPKNPDSSAQHF